VEDMPDVNANAFAIAFGDFNRGYGCRVSSIRLAR
jgi:HK97 family phage major capsid protein